MDLPIGYFFVIGIIIIGLSGYIIWNKLKIIKLNKENDEMFSLIKKNHIVYLRK